MHNAKHCEMPALSAKSLLYLAMLTRCKPTYDKSMQSTERAESLSGRTRKAGAMVRSRAEVWLKSDWAEVTGGADAPPEAVQEGALSPHLEAPYTALSGSPPNHSVGQPPRKRLVRLSLILPGTSAPQLRLGVRP